MKTLHVYMVSNPDTFGGGSMPAASPEDAARKSVGRWWLKDAKRIEVKSFAVGPIGKWTFDAATLAEMESK